MTRRDESISRAFALGVLSGLFIIGLALRLIRISEVGLWLDEAFSLLLAQMPLAEMTHLLPMDDHPPLWYWLLHIWGAHQVTWARLLPVVIGSASILILCAATRESLGEKVALASAGILAVHPVHVHFSQELRSYAMQALVMTLLILVGMRALRRPVNATLWVALTLMSLAMMAVHYFAGALLAGFWAVILFVQWRRFGERSALILLTSPVLALVSIMPWVTRIEWGLISGDVGGGGGSGGGGAPRSSWSKLQELLMETQGFVRVAPWEWFGLEGGSAIWATIWGIVITALVCWGGIALLRDRERRPAGFLILGMLGVGFLITVAYCVMGFLFFNRQLVLFLIPIVILMASGLAHLPGKWGGVVGALLGVTLLSCSLGDVTREMRQGSTRMADWMAQEGWDRATIICESKFLALPLHTLLPDSDIGMYHIQEGTDLYRDLMGHENLVEHLPEDWREGETCLALMGGGEDEPRDRVIWSRAISFARELGVDVNEADVEILHVGDYAMRSKWVSLVLLNGDGNEGRHLRE